MELTHVTCHGVAWKAKTEAIPITIKAMFFTTELLRTLRKPELGETTVAMKAIKTLPQGFAERPIMAAPQGFAEETFNLGLGRLL